ncbi:TMEM175 family protein [Stenotrophomonas acidaminiphila]|uniref:TMEM175 family protein n=1 Tax=Stenotrophomonas acidaminiphila TaxID=128780 RepID=UPI003BF2F6BB
MGKGRLEAFSDGVLAIIITIMVLEMKAPEGATLDALLPLAPSLLSYMLSFIYVGIYWNNHHHLLQACRRVTGSVLWANLHLLFWLSLLPFATRWMGNNHLAPLPSVAYGLVLLASAIAYWLLQRRIIAADGSASVLRHALGGDWKGKLSPLLYLAGIGATLADARLGQALYALVALLWLIPDRRIEHELEH